MLKQLKSSQLGLSNERIGQNYGRASLSLLVQLAPWFYSQTLGMEIFRLVPLSRLTANIIEVPTSISAMEISLK